MQVGNPVGENYSKHLAIPKIAMKAPHIILSRFARLQVKNDVVHGADKLKAKHIYHPSYINTCICFLSSLHKNNFHRLFKKKLGLLPSWVIYSHKEGWMLRNDVNLLIFFDILSKKMKPNSCWYIIIYSLDLQNVFLEKILLSASKVSVKTYNAYNNNLQALHLALNN